MAPTIKEIARLAGVSRGTVDRVIHKRPGVSPEVRSVVEKILREMDYEPNTAAVALKSTSRNINLGAIVPDLRNEFFHEVHAGIQEAARRFKGFGITVVEYRMKESVGEELIRGIDMMTEAGVDGISMQAIDSEQVCRRMRSLPPGFPVVTFNSDFTSSERLCFVGQDSFAAGRVAGQMMAMQLRTPGKVAVIIGYSTLAHQKERASGFCQAIQTDFPEAEIIGPFKAREDEARAYRIVSDIICRTHDLVGIYAAGGGQKSVALALAESGRSSEIIMVGHDLLPKTLEYLEQGVVNCTIAQEPYYQGYAPVEILSEYLLFGKLPGASQMHTAIDIRVKDNAEFNGLRSFAGDRPRRGEDMAAGQT